MEGKPALAAAYAVIRVVIADDHRVLRQALIELLDSYADFCVVGSAGTAAEAIAQCAKHLPDMVLLDARMPGGGAAAAATITRLHPTIEVVGLTAASDAGTHNTMRRNGAIAILNKAQPRDLAPALMEIHVAVNSTVNPHHECQ